MTVRPFGNVLLLIPILAACRGDIEIERPRPLFEEAPIEYPVTLWDQGVEGETLLRVRVDESGVVDSVVVLETSGHSELDDAAVAGARDLRFTPGKKKGKSIRVWAQVPVHFSRKPDPAGTPDG